MTFFWHQACMLRLAEQAVPLDLDFPLDNLPRDCSVGQIKQAESRLNVVSSNQVSLLKKGLPVSIVEGPRQNSQS